MFLVIACNFILGHMLVSTCRCNCVPRHSYENIGVNVVELRHSYANVGVNVVEP